LSDKPFLDASREPQGIERLPQTPEDDIPGTLSTEEMAFANDQQESIWLNSFLGIKG
jgi:hypothetical protein